MADCRDPDVLAAYEMNAHALADPGWRDVARCDGEAPTQAFARRLIAAGFDAMLAPSFARGTRPTDVNLVIWSWGRRPGALLSLVDDEGRLSS